jgi:putative membrane protein
MGAADVVPGVSGGTVALVLGIYERLVTAISHVDLKLLRMLRGGRLREAARHVDLRFLCSLGCGIALGLLIMMIAMHRLLTHDASRALTLAAFFGMIAGSSVLVAMRIRVQTPFDGLRLSLFGLNGAAVALWLAMSSGDKFEPTYPYVFVCGAIAICAMILPGISGAMMLVLLGVYTHLTGIPEALLRGENVGQALLTIAVFGTGCAVTLVCFSKVLRWLLVRWQSPTMALLCGLMFGSLPKLWPFQYDATPAIENWKDKEFERYWPTAVNAQVISVLLVVLASTAVVLAVHWLSHGRANRPLSSSHKLCEEAKG